MVSLLPGLSPLRVLVADDCEDTASSWAALLRLWGHEVQVAHSGSAALRASRELEPDVVLLDLALPGMDGLEVARRMRQEQGLQRSLLVAVTGCEGESLRRRVGEVGFDIYLLKPFEPDVLRSLLGFVQEAIRRERAGSLLHSPCVN